MPSDTWRAIAPDPHWTPSAYWLAATTIVAAVFGTTPAALDLVESWRLSDSSAAAPVARWAILLLLLGVLQLAYGVYLLQLPDWTSVWVVTLLWLATAGCYALALGIVLTSSDQGWLVGPAGLQVADQLAGGQAALWCLCMLSMSILLAFFAGRLSGQWRRAERMVRSVQVGQASSLP